MMPVTSTSVRPAAKLAALTMAVALVAAACSSGDGDGEQTTGRSGSQGEAIVAQVASYNLAVGRPARFIVGALTPDNQFVAGGVATMRFTHLDGGGAGPEVPATFLALPGEDPDHQHAHAHAGPSSEGRGVYATEVEFDRAGPWQVEIAVEVDGETMAGTAAFQVAEEHSVPAVGDEALPTENLTMEDAGEAPPGAIDSRGGGGGDIPDRELHATTIAASLRAGRPIVAVFATPVFCVSQFCGPITDMVDELRVEYGDRADFVHVEIWRDFQNQVINKAAADWLLRDGNLNEPWVFFIDDAGVIRARWDNVATRGEIEPFLEDLPPLS